jgi:hypothetical protein
LVPAISAEYVGFAATVERQHDDTADAHHEGH